MHTPTKQRSVRAGVVKVEAMLMTVGVSAAVAAEVCWWARCWCLLCVLFGSSDDQDGPPTLSFFDKQD